MSERRRILLPFLEKEVTDKISYGIEHYRKGDAKIKVVDKDGKPIPGARIKVTQKTHEFRFGANLFMLDELESEEKNEKYKKYFSKIFNMATLPFYWDTLEPERGKPRYAKDSPKIYRRPSPDLCIEFCEKHGIEPREHALAYEAFFPKWLYGENVETIKRELERRYSEISKRYADRIPTIEVTNEMLWAEGKTSFYYEPDFVEWCFRLAEKYFPSNELAINEATQHTWSDECRATNRYYAYIEENLRKGVRIDAIGLQYHLFVKREEEYDLKQTWLNPKKLYEHMDLYADFEKPLQITEVTVPSYSWDPEDEEIQAELLERLYSIWFSHPSVEQIVYWNLVDGYAHLWDPDPNQIKASQGNMTLGENYYYGGLLRFDLSPKPAYHRLKELIQKRWHTEAALVTDGNGCADFRGFYGEYTAEIELHGEALTTKLSLSKACENTVEIVL